LAWHALFWLSGYVASHRLVVAPQSGAKDQFYCSFNIALNSNCEAREVSKNLKKGDNRVKSQN
jgi:hypothetical protein